MILQPILLDEQEVSIPLRMKMIESLARFRQGWQALAEGQSLLNIQAPIGLILVDIADRFELDEQKKVLCLAAS
jgi:hypothetical protein